MRLRYGDAVHLLCNEHDGTSKPLCVCVQTGMLAPGCFVRTGPGNVGIGGHRSSSSQHHDHDHDDDGPGFATQHRTLGVLRPECRGADSGRTIHGGGCIRVVSALWKLPDPRPDAPQTSFVCTKPGPRQLRRADEGATELRTCRDCGHTSRTNS